MSARPAAMPFIMVTVLIDMISIGLIIPVLPTLIGSFTQSPAEQVTWYMVITGTFGLANFVGSPILGSLSDRFGRRPVMLIGFSGLALGFFVTALATQLWMLIVVRLFSGAMQANMAIANAYVADITPPEDRAKRFGLLGAAFGVGFILGPVMGGKLGDINLHLPFFVAGGLALCNLVYGIFVLPESLPRALRMPFSWAKANPVGSLRHLFELEGLGALMGVMACLSLAQYILWSTWALYTQLKFGWSMGQVGNSLFAVGLMSAVVQGGLVGQLLKLMSARRLVVLGLLSSAICYVGWGASPEGWMMYVFIFANVLGVAAGASMQSLISNAADPNSQGRTMGAVAGLSSLAAVIAPVVGPMLLRNVVHLPRGDWRFGAPYYLCAVLALLALWLIAVHFARHPQAADGAPSVAS